jgi:hypothetical protein
MPIAGNAELPISRKQQDLLLLVLLYLLAEL